MLIVNADDLGRTPEATDKSLFLYRRQRITSASAMVFMQDSARAAERAVEADLETGLHLNLDLPFDGPNVPGKLNDRHRRIMRYLSRGKWAQVAYHPSLKKDFCQVFQAQWDEYVRLYGRDPVKVDGHHHFHLCLNMVIDRIIPRGLRVRRNFTFSFGEKDIVNLLYRRLLDEWLTRRYVCADAFFSIEPVPFPPRLAQIVRRGRIQNVELMIHPGIRDQFEALQSPETEALLESAPLGRYSQLPLRTSPGRLGKADLF